MTILANIICAPCGYVLNSEKNAGNQRMHMFKGFWYIFSLQKVLPPSSPTDSGTASVECGGTGGGGVEGERSRRGNGEARHAGPGGDDKGFHFHPEQDGQPRRWRSNNLIYLRFFF